MTRRVLLSVKALVAIVLLSILFLRIDTVKTAVILSETHEGILTLAFGVFLTKVVFGAMRNQVLLTHGGYHFTLASLVRYYLIGYFFNMFLPTVVGGDIARGYYLYRDSGKSEKTISTIILERALGIAAMMLMSVFAVIFAQLSDVDVLSKGSIKSIFGLFSAGFLFSVVFFIPGVESLVYRLRLRSLPSFMNAPLNVICGVLQYSRMPGVVLKAFVLSILFQFPSILATFMIAVSLGDSTSFLYFLIFLPVIWLVTMAPISINGLGVREGVFVMLFGTVGMSMETAVAVSLLWLAMTVITGVLGGIVFFFEGEGFSDIKEFRSA